LVTESVVCVTPALSSRLLSAENAAADFGHIARGGDWPEDPRERSMPVSDDDIPQAVLIVRAFRIGASEEDLSNVVVRLSSSRVGPHYDFLFDAPMLDRLAGALREAAEKIRRR
jgi:hypothetical protein